MIFLVLFTHSSKVVLSKQTRLVWSRIVKLSWYVSFLLISTSPPTCQKILPPYPAIIEFSEKLQQVLHVWWTCIACLSNKILQFILGYFASSSANKVTLRICFEVEIFWFTWKHTQVKNKSTKWIDNKCWKNPLTCWMLGRPIFRCSGIGRNLSCFFFWKNGSPRHFDAKGIFELYQGHLAGLPHKAIRLSTPRRFNIGMYSPWK